MGSETILLVEDEEDLRELTAKILRGSGYTVFEASDGQKALQLAGNYRQDMHLLLTDVIMPGTSGSELAANLKVYRPDMKVVYMSGYTGNLIASHGVIDTDSTLLEKPFSKQVLLEHVRAALDARR
jgi:DNA-binding NtrC family response regulator